MAGNSVARVYLDSDGPNPILSFEVIDHNGIKLADPFNAITHATLFIYGPSITVDSRVTPEAFNWRIGNGALELKLGFVDVPAGAYRARIKLYDPLHTDGQVLTHEHGPNYLMLQFL